MAVMKGSARRSERKNVPDKEKRAARQALLAKIILIYSKNSAKVSRKVGRIIRVDVEAGKSPQERRGMDTSGSARFMRTALVVSVALLVALVSALAVGLQADAHETAGRTLIYVDGERVKATQDDHFVYRQRLSSGCHTIKVIQKRGGEIISQSIRRYCSGEPTKLIVKVDDGSVSSTTRTLNTNTTSDSA